MENAAPDGPRIIGSHDAADLLGVSQRTVQRMADTGTIPVIRTTVGRRREYLFDADAIEEYAHKSS